MKKKSSNYITFSKNLLSNAFFLDVLSEYFRLYCLAVMKASLSSPGYTCQVWSAADALLEQGSTHFMSQDFPFGRGESSDKENK